MSDAKPIVVKCPTCKADVIWSAQSEFRPFCSERCKNTDFISWANAEHQLPGEPLLDELMSEDIERER